MLYNNDTRYMYLKNVYLPQSISNKNKHGKSHTSDNSDLHDFAFEKVPVFDCPGQTILTALQ